METFRPKGKHRAPRPRHPIRQIAAGGVGFVVLLATVGAAKQVPALPWPAGATTVQPAAFIVVDEAEPTGEASSVPDVIDTYTRDIALAPEYVAPPPPPPPPAPEPPPPPPKPKPEPLPEVVAEAPPPVVVPEVKRRHYSGLGVKSHVQDVAEVVGSKFNVTRIGGYRASAIDPNGHPSGLALDFFVDRETGDRMARHLLDNPGTYGTDYVIWQQRIAFPGKDWRGMKDRGGATANHRDHLHVNIRR